MRSGAGGDRSRMETSFIILSMPPAHSERNLSIIPQNDGVGRANRISKVEIGERF